MLLEFRVPLPYNVEDPNIGYRYMCMLAHDAATGGGEGVDWLVNEEYVVRISIYAGGGPLSYASVYRTTKDLCRHCVVNFTSNPMSA